MTNEYDANAALAGETLMDSMERDRVRELLPLFGIDPATVDAQRAVYDRQHRAERLRRVLFD